MTTQPNPSSEIEEDILQSNAEILAQLETLTTTTASDTNTPTSVTLDAIREYPSVFRSRGINQHHVSDLCHAIKRNGVLDPVTVLKAGDQFILIDGYHRTEAYRRSDIKTPIPVIYFQGTVRDAVLESGKANSKNKLIMTTQEKQNYAWRLVCMERFSKREIMEAAAIARGQVGNMRRVLNHLGDDAGAYDSWYEASRAASGQDNPIDKDDDWKQAQAQVYADRMREAFG